MGLKDSHCLSLPLFPMSFLCLYSQPIHKGADDGNAIFRKAFRLRLTEENPLGKVWLYAIIEHKVQVLCPIVNSELSEVNLSSSMHSCSL